MDANLTSLPYGSSSVTSSTLSSTSVDGLVADGGAGFQPGGPGAPAAAEPIHHGDGLPEAEASARWDRTMSWAARDSAQAVPCPDRVPALGAEPSAGSVLFAEDVKHAFQPARCQSV